MSKIISVSIIGATGYTGLELIRILMVHPNVEIKYLISESSPGKKISDLWPHLSNICDLTLQNIDLDLVANESDCVFLALPHYQSQEIIKKIIGKSKIIDLSADFRLSSAKTYLDHYQYNHTCPEVLPLFTYGIPEFYKNKIAKQQNIANPGCFAITTQLALYPVKDFINQVYIQGITGSSGSGKSASEGTHHPVRNNNLKSYKIGVHQHTGEILENLELLPSAFHFVPTSGPFTRGIHLTAFIQPTPDLDLAKVQNIFELFYKDSPFVRLKKNVQLNDVVGSNYCDISISIQNNQLIVQAVIDNLVKGASGNAIQNFNIINDLPETTGLNILAPLFP